MIRGVPSLGCPASSKRGRVPAMTRVCALVNNDFTRDIRVDRELRTLTASGYSVTLFAARSGSPLVPTPERVDRLETEESF